LHGHTWGQNLVVLIGQRKALGMAVRNNRTQNRVSRIVGAIGHPGLMPARNCIPGPARILRQILLHLGCGFKVAVFFDSTPAGWG
jgi:hypothetical protein